MRQRAELEGHVAGLTVRVETLRAKEQALLADGAVYAELEAHACRVDAVHYSRSLAELEGELAKHDVEAATATLDDVAALADGDLGTANLYVPLTVAEAAAKVEHLLTAFPSQLGRTWYTEETFRAVLRLRGIECRAPDGLAEAFICRKLVV